MATDLFSASGISAWQARLNRSPSFTEAAGSWAGRLLLIEQTGDGARAKHLGRCR